MVCLDTEILVGLLKNEDEAVKTIGRLEDGAAPLTTTAITAYELFKGAEISKKSKENLRLIKDVLKNLHLLDLDTRASETAAKVYRDLREMGELVGEFDILIASICLANDETLISNDEHFARIPGLRLKNW